MVKKIATITPDVINGKVINGEKTCFIISPFGKKGSPDYIYFLQVRKYIIDTVVKEKGYKTTRADDIEAPGKITTQIINYLRDSDLVIADLSESNANVFYELAIRDAVRKPVILIRNSDFETPFDVRDQRYLKYSLDLDEIEESKKKLAGYIDAIEDPTFRVTSPVTMALITPSDEISASSQDYFKMILEKLSSLSTNIARSKAPRAVLERPRIDMKEHLRLLGVYVIERDPSSTKPFNEVSGVALNRMSFMRILNANIEKGISVVNYDPTFEIFWLWEYGNESIWYYHDESLDDLTV